MIDRAANTKDITVKITGNTRFPANVKSPMFACVNKTNTKEAIMVALDDFIVFPINSAIKLMDYKTSPFCHAQKTPAVTAGACLYISFLFHPAL